MPLTRSFSSPAGDGLRLSARAAGAGWPVVLLHPVGLCSSFWQPVWGMLAARYFVLAPDFRGHGASDRPRHPFTLEDLADDVAALMTSSRTAHPVTFVGVSLGGMVAQVLALRHPTFARSLVLVDTACTFGEEARRALSDRADRAESRGMETLATETVARWFTSSFCQSHSGVVDDARRKLTAVDPQVHAWTWRAIAELDVCCRLSELDIPALVVVGSEDVSTPPQVARELASRLREAEYIEIAGAGHMSVTEKPKRFTSIVMDFIARRVDGSM